MCFRQLHQFLMAGLLLAILSDHTLAQSLNPERSRTTSTQYNGSDWLSQSNGQRTAWRLGVSGENTETGVLVRQVTPNSAAAGARIEPGDIIVNVAGFQVGMVGGRLYDLADEINRRADTSGLVTLVVQDHISNRLAAVRVRLNRGENYLTGSVVYSQLGPLPVDAILTVKISNTTRPYSQIIQHNNDYRLLGSGEVPFNIMYDPTYLDSNDVYIVSASVSSGGRVLYTSSQNPRVLTQGNPTTARLQLVSVERLASSTQPVTTVTAGYPGYNTLPNELDRMYRHYLGRPPTNLELVAAENTPGIAQHLDEFPLKLMAGQEYFDRAGNNSTLWTSQVFEELVGRNPNQQELALWLNRYEQLRRSRMAMLQQLQSAVK